MKRVSFKPVRRAGKTSIGWFAMTVRHVMADGGVLSYTTPIPYDMHPRSVNATIDNVRARLISDAFAIEDFSTRWEKTNQRNQQQTIKCR